MISNELQMGKAGEHIACADLIIQGYNAFMADQGLPYDILVDIEGKVYKIQVKSTMELSEVQSERPVAYRFQMRKGRCQSPRRIPISPSTVDFYAFVILKTKTVAYLPSLSIIGASGMILQTIDFRDRSVSYTKPQCGRYFQDYHLFKKP